MVVPGRVEPLPRRVERVGVEVGVENPLFVPQRAGEVLAARREDRGAATPDELVPGRERDVVGIARRALEDAAREHERARLACDVAQRVLPALAVLCRGREVDLDATLVQGEAR